MFNLSHQSRISRHQRRNNYFYLSEQQHLTTSCSYSEIPRKGFILFIKPAFLVFQDDEEAVLESEKEAEKMIVEAYSALLLAFLSTERFFSFSIVLYVIIYSFKKLNMFLDSLAVQVYATPSKTISRNAISQFLYRSWRDLWYVPL